MGAQIQINGVTAQKAVVAFGSTVSLTNAAAVGSSQKWELTDYPLDVDDLGPDFPTNFPAWTVAGDGTYFINQASGPFGAVTFKPDVTGTYRFRLTSTEGGPVVQTAVVRVREIHTGEHLPAAGEKTEEDGRQGHKKITNGRLKRLGKFHQGCVRVVNISGSSIARGKVVRLVGAADGHTVSPNINPGGSAAAKAEKVFTIAVADNTAAAAAFSDYAVLEEDIANNSFGWARKFGLFEGKSDVNYTGFGVGNPVFFDNAGNQISSRPASGFAIAVGWLLENGSAGTVAVGLAAVTQPGSADWAPYPKGVRVYAVDYDAGSDAAALGYVDATDITDAAITTAMVAAGAAPLKTWEELQARLPRFGAGRAVIVAIKNRAGGATYLKKDGVTIQDLTLRGYPGYIQIRLLATSDFSNSALDKIKSGAMTSDAGPNGDGSWTVNAAGTTLSCSVVTAVSSLPADPTALGRRIRFDPATTTTALRNKGVTIQNNTASAITFCNAAAAAPQNGDTFFIEKPGVVFGAWTIDVQSPIVIRGLAAAAGSSGVIVQCGTRDLSVDGFHPTASLSFCSSEGTVGTFIMGSFYVWCRSTLASIDPAAGSENTGGGWRSGGTFNVEYCTRAIIDTSGAVTNNQSFWVELPYGAVGQGCYFVGGATPLISLDTCGAGSVAGAKSGNDWGTFSGAFHFGTGQLTASFSPTRIDGRLRLQGSPIAVDGVAITQAGAGSDSAALSLRMEGGEVRIDNVTGSAGNTAYGIGLTRCRNTRVVIQNTTTLTGTSGDILVNLQDDSQSVALSYTGLSVTNVPDDAGNDICKASVPKYVLGPALALQNKDGTALALGEVVRISGAAQCVRARADTSAHADGPLYVALAATANNVYGFFVPMTTPQKWLLFDAVTPAIAALTYISPGTGGAATVTVPAAAGTNQKRRVGHVVANSGSLGLVTGSPELLTVDANGLA